MSVQSDHSPTSKTNDALIRLSVLDLRIARDYSNSAMHANLKTEIEEIHNWIIDEKNVEQFAQRAVSLANRIGCSSVIATFLLKVIKKLGCRFTRSSVDLCNLLLDNNKHIDPSTLESCLSQMLQRMDPGLVKFNKSMISCCIQYCKLCSVEQLFILVLEKCCTKIIQNLSELLQNDNNTKSSKSKISRLIKSLVEFYCIAYLKLTSQQECNTYRTKIWDILSNLLPTKSEKYKEEQLRMMTQRLLNAKANPKWGCRMRYLTTAKADGKLRKWRGMVDKLDLNRIVVNMVFSLLQMEDNQFLVEDRNGSPEQQPFKEIKRNLYHITLVPKGDEAGPETKNKENINPNNDSVRIRFPQKQSIGRENAKTVELRLDLGIEGEFQKQLEQELQKEKCVHFKIPEESLISKSKSQKKTILQDSQQPDKQQQGNKQQPEKQEQRNKKSPTITALEQIEFSQSPTVGKSMELEEIVSLATGGTATHFKETESKQENVLASLNGISLNGLSLMNTAKMLDELDNVSINANAVEQTSKVNELELESVTKLNALESDIKMSDILSATKVNELELETKTNVLDDENNEEEEKQVQMQLCLTPVGTQGVVDTVNQTAKTHKVEENVASSIISIKVLDIEENKSPVVEEQGWNSAAESNSGIVNFDIKEGEDSSSLIDTLELAYDSIVNNVCSMVAFRQDLESGLANIHLKTIQQLSESSRNSENSEPLVIHEVEEIEEITETEGMLENPFESKSSPLSDRKLTFLFKNFCIEFTSERQDTTMTGTDMKECVVVTLPLEGFQSRETVVQAVQHKKNYLWMKDHEESAIFGKGRLFIYNIWVQSEPKAIQLVECGKFEMNIYVVPYLNIGCHTFSVILQVQKPRGQQSQWEKAGQMKITNIDRSYFHILNDSLEIIVGSSLHITDGGEISVDQQNLSFDDIAAYL